MSETLNAVIDEVVIQPSKIQPIIVNFQNGVLKDEETSRIKCGIYHDTNCGKAVLAMSNGQTVYKGYRPDYDKELTYTMLAIHNRRTGKIRLVQAERWEVTPVLDKRVDVDDNATVTEKIGALSKQFGSKRSKRRTEQYERLNINIDSVKDQLEKSVADVKINRADLSIKSDCINELENHLPQCDRDASSPENVYNLYDIIPEKILKSVSEKINEIMDSDDERKSEFYKQMMKQLGSDSKMTKKIVILEYIEAICTCFKLPAKDFKKRGLEIYPISLQMNNHILDTYSMPGSYGRLRPNSMKDKGIIHSMILALIVSNFKLDIELFTSLFSECRISAKRFANVARIIGAMPTKENKRIYALKVPLPPPLKPYRKGRGK